MDEKMQRFGVAYTYAYKKSGIRNISGEYDIADQTLANLETKFANHPQRAKEEWNREFNYELESWQRYIWRDVKNTMAIDQYKTDNMIYVT